MSFKLLAIRPLEDCNEKFLKNLEVNEIYKFYDDYEFEDGIGHSLKDNEPQMSIKFVRDKKQSVPKNMYGENINVSAIVGKNGSGKSALVELLIATIVKISLIIDENFINPEELYDTGDKDSTLNQFQNNLKKFKDSLTSDLENLNVEIYYQHNSEYGATNKSNKIITYNSGKGQKIRCIHLNGENVIIKDQIGKSVSYFKLTDLDDANPNSQKISQELFYFVGDLFYLMVINYSHYGFNTDEIGEWIKGVFHKNDGYQLPVVINPYRDNGNIDINSERDLAKSRFLVNVLQEKKLREIQKNKIISHLSIKLNHSKFIWDKAKNKDLRILNSQNEKEKILKLIFEKYRVKTNLDLIKKNFFFNYAVDYLLIKLKKITKYSNYIEYSSSFKQKTLINKQDGKITQFKIIIDEQFTKYIENLLFDSSHVTDKFRQTLFFLRYCYLDEKKIGEGIVLDINELNKWIKTAYVEEIDDTINSLNKDELILFKEGYENRKEKYDVSHSLPSFFEIEYYFEKKISGNNFSVLSSGEKQRIFSIHSVIYHIRNLISIKTRDKLIRYKNINIVFDEIELYAHPNFQRTFIYDLLNSLKVINLKEHSLNIIFITHSPFILSDIPKQNVLFLEVNEFDKKSRPVSYEGDNTFGANIHEMLTNGFFMESTKGEFALIKIMEFLDFYQKVFDAKEIDIPKLKGYYISNGENFRLLIDIIGEIQIRTILENHIRYIENKLGIEDDVETRIIKLEEELNKLRKIKRE
jgi:hypothetical protein